MNMKKIWENPLAGSLTNQERVSTPEMLIGYLIGPFGAMLSSGIFTSFLQAYLGDVLGLSAGFLSALQLVSTVFIVAANLIVGQLIERTHTNGWQSPPLGAAVRTDAVCCERTDVHCTLSGNRALHLDCDCL